MHFPCTLPILSWIESVPSHLYQQPQEGSLLTKEQKVLEGAVRRELSGTPYILIMSLGLAMSLFHLYTAGFGLLEAILQRSIHLSFALSLIFLLYPFRRGKKENKIPVYDYVLAFLGAYAPSYIVIHYHELIQRAGYLTTMDFVMGVIVIVLIFDASRRVVGLTLPFIALLFLLYSYFGAYIPGTLGHRGFSLTSIVRHMYLTTEGIFGVSLGVTASFIFLFILFGVILSVTGTGQVFIDLAMSLFGKSKGGPAKVAVVSSSLFGTINGSSVANIMGTGLFTIPLMKKTGYQPHFAGAVEATASAGGQIMPPIMGAGAFIMAEFLGISYLQVALAAALPAILYYIGVFASVHIEANRLGLKGLTADKLPKFREVLIQRGILLIPLAVLVVYMFGGYTPTKSAFIAIVVCLVINWFVKKYRLSFKQWMEVLSRGALDALDLVVACALIGFIIGTASLTGLGIKVADIIISAAGANIFLALILTHIVCILLGMGLPTTAKYIVVAMIAVPALSELNIPPIAAHLFIFYFAILSDITPPVAMGSMAAAGIAQADFMKTSITSIKLALAGFIIPYFFVFSPELILGYSPFGWKIIIVMITSISSVYLLSASTSGWLFGRMSMWERVVTLAGALLLVSPDFLTDVIGVVLVAIVGIANFQKHKRSTQIAAENSPNSSMNV